ISPEQATGAASVVDARADVYSLGACLYEALTGTPPYGSGSPKTVFKNLREGTLKPVRSHRADCPEEIDAIVMKAIARSADYRFATALELAEALDAAGARLAPDPLSREGSIRFSSPDITPFRGDTQTSRPREEKLPVEPAAPKKKSHESKKPSAVA